MKYILVLFVTLISATTVYAQAGEGSTRFSQVGAFVGKMLPNGVAGTDEIFSLWGLRYSSPIGKGNSFADFGTLMGKGNGVTWQGGFASLSMHIPVETLIGHAGVGLDITRYESANSPAKNIGGGHFIGGIMTKIGGNVLARFDMKLNSKPGTSLFFGLGLVIELDGASADTPN